jgi:hypothetical protein
MIYFGGRGVEAIYNFRTLGVEHIDMLKGRFTIA